MPKHKIYDNFWDEFEAQCASVGIVSKVPKSMKTLLTACGYNSAWSFKSVAEDKLVELEEYIEKHHRNIADQFDEYKSVKPFVFLPGHRALILGIKLELAELQDIKRPKKQAKIQPVLNEKDHQTALIQQVSTFAEQHGLKVDWSNTIQDFNLQQTENTVFCQCTILCPVCRSSFVIRYDTYWKVSNIYKHIKKHANGATNNSKGLNITMHNTKNITTSQPKSNEVNANNMAIAQASALAGASLEPVFEAIIVEVDESCSPQDEEMCHGDR